MLACKCMLSLVCRTRTNTHTHPGTGLPHCQADITSTVKRAIQIWRVIKLAKYIKSTWCTVWCVSIYRQHGWNRTRGHRNSASNRSLKMVLALELLQKTPLSSHLNDIYFGLLQDVGRYTSKLCETVLTFHNDLPIWSAEVKNSRSEQRWSGAEVETGDFQQGSWAWKNLRILATCCFWQHRRQREGSTLFSLFDCKQWGDLKPFTTAMATDFECQPSCAFLF